MHKSPFPKFSSIIPLLKFGTFVRFVGFVNEPPLIGRTMDVIQKERREHEKAEVLAGFRAFAEDLLQLWRLDLVSGLLRCSDVPCPID